MQRNTAAVLLAVQPIAPAQALLSGRTASISDGVRVDATGSRRRVQALAAAGWTFPALAGRLTKHDVLARATDVRRLVDGGRAQVRWETTVAVAAVYTALAYLPGPPAGGRPGPRAGLAGAVVVGGGHHRLRRARPGRSGRLSEVAGWNFGSVSP